MCDRPTYTSELHLNCPKVSHFLTVDQSPGLAPSRLATLAVSNLLTRSSTGMFVCVSPGKSAVSAIEPITVLQLTRSQDHTGLIEQIDPCDLSLTSQTSPSLHVYSVVICGPSLDNADLFVSISCTTRGTTRVDRSSDC